MPNHWGHESFPGFVGQPVTYTWTTFRCVPKFLFLIFSIGPSSQGSTAKSAYAARDWQGNQNHGHQQAMKQVRACHWATAVDGDRGTTTTRFITRYQPMP
jgi:hypothetical protein